ncbi:FxSxx-COOH system tetratricopeptide repeat protein [Streptomyces chartreusis]
MAAGSLHAETIYVGGSAPNPLPERVTVAPPLGLRDPSRPLRGRGALLERVESALSPSGGQSMQVLCGMGGCGKTFLALEVAHRRTRAGQQVWWIDARQGTTLEAGLRAVARHAGATDEQLNAGDTADVLWSALSQLAAPWLLVVDNADDPALLDGPGSLRSGTGWLRPHTCPLGSVLITTRDSSAATWGSLCTLYPVRPLSDADEIADAAQILLDYTSHEAGTVHDVRRLADRLGGLPLALRLAGTYLAEANQVPSAYRDPSTPTDVRSYQRALDADLRQVDPEDVISQTWAMSMRLLEKRGDALARPLLELISTFANAPLPYTLLLTPTTLGAARELAHLDGPGVWKLLTALASLGLLDLAEPNTASGALPTARVHPLVRDATRSQTAISTAISALHSAAYDGETGIPEEPAYWDCWRLLQPHAQYLFHRAETDALPEHAMFEAARSAVLAARYLYTHGLYHQARAEFEAILSYERESLGETHSLTLATRHCLAGVLRDQGELAEARAEFEAILAEDRERLGETHPSTLTTRHEFAGLLQDQGELAEARAEFEAILALRRESLGETHPHTLAARHNLAGVLQNQGELAEARAEFEAILSYERESLGETHPSTLITRHSLAGVLQDQGELAEARAEFEAILAHERERLGETHPRTLTTRHSLAGVLRDQGELAEARAEFEAILALRRESLGETHPHTLATRHELAGVLQEQGELAEARAEFEAILAPREGPGETHADTM